MDMQKLESTGYAQGCRFSDEADVWTYFTVKNMQAMFGPKDDLTQPELNEMAAYVIANRLHLAPSPEKTPIQIWRFEDAPKHLQDQSNNGGDEDWIALVPAAYENEHMPWLDLDEHGPFGCCCVHKIPQPDGAVLHIGCHS